MCNPAQLHIKGCAKGGQEHQQQWVWNEDSMTFMHSVQLSFREIRAKVLAMLVLGQGTAAGARCMQGGGGPPLHLQGR